MADPTSGPAPSGDLIGGDPSVTLSSNRTALSFERTRMSADRTLMSVIRTALSLISFGFTIFSFFGKLAQSLGTETVTRASARNFGVALVLLGTGLLIAGLIAHFTFMKGLGARRDDLHAARLMRHGAHFPTSPTVVIAILLLALGMACTAGMLWRAGPFA